MSNTEQFETMDAAMKSIESMVRIHEEWGGEFRLDMHPEGGMRAKFIGRDCILFAVNITAEEAVIDLANLLVERGVAWR